MSHLQSIIELEFMKKMGRDAINGMLDIMEQQIKNIRAVVNQEMQIFGYSTSEKMILDIIGFTEDHTQFIARPSGKTGMFRYDLSDVCFTVDQYEKLVSQIGAVAMFTHWERREVQEHPYGEKEPIFCIPRVVK